MVEVCILDVTASRWAADGRSAALNLIVAVEETVMLACSMVGVLTVISKASGSNLTKKAAVTQKLKEAVFQ